MISFQKIQFRYDPYPIGVASPVMDSALYEELVRNFPPPELLRNTGKHGLKHSLSIKNDKARYESWIRSHPVWKEFRDYLQSDAFILSTLETLHDHGIDLGYSRDNLTSAARVRMALRHLASGRIPSPPAGLTSRMEFSALPADGGRVLPHTDTPKKIVTVVMSMVAKGEWDPALGGGLEIMRPRDPRRNYNFVNEQLGFDDVETLEVLDFQDNQAVVFVKTFNSLHGVRPMTGVGRDAWRRTLTITIVKDH